MAITEEYQKELRRLHLDNRWGKSAVRYCGYKVVGLIKTRPYIRTVLDYGCGRGSLRPYIMEHCPGVTVYEYDPGVENKDKISLDSYDMVITCDVLEHVEPEEIHKTVQELWALTKYVMYNDISCVPTYDLFKSGPHVGKDKHLLVQKPDWWEAMFWSALQGNDKKSVLVEAYSWKKSVHPGKHRPDGWHHRAIFLHEVQA